MTPGTAPDPAPFAPAIATPSFVGRERELATLRTALDAALGGRGALVLIGGPAGIGKTALAEVALTEATSRGALVLVGRCYDLSETPPYGPWTEALARAPSGDGLPTLPLAVLPPEREGEALTGQDAILRRILAYLAACAARHPLVLLLDDLHWADPASRDLLRVVARQIADLPILVLATYRADEITPDHPLAPLLLLLVREARADRLDLRPLDKEAIGTLVDGRYHLNEPDRDRLVGYLVGRTEGNALFLDELLRTLEVEGLLQPGTLDASGGNHWALGDLTTAPVPTLLRQVIAGRLARLAQEDQRLLAVAAVIGQEVPLSAWATVSDVTEDTLLDHAERAVEARLLTATPDGSGVRFAHGLIREALYSETSALRRRALHRRVGEALAAAPRPDPDAVAYHFQQIGDPRAVEWLVRAGLRALGSAQITAAERFATAAGLLAGEVPRARERGWLLYLSADLLIFADTERALRHLDEVDQLALISGDQALVANGHYLRGQVHVHRGQLRAGVAGIERGVAEIQELPGDEPRWAGDQLALARIGALLPGGKQALSLSARARGLPPALNQRSELANWYAWAGRYREARAMDEATIAALGDDAAQEDAQGRYGLAHALAPLGLPLEARREYARARASSYARNDLYVVAYLTFAELQHAVLPCQADDVAERTRLAAEADQAWARVQDAVTASPYPSQADLPLALLEGRWAEARRLAEAGVVAGTPGHAQGASAAIGLLARHQGDAAAAWAQVRTLHPAGPDTEPGDCSFVPGLGLQVLAVELALDAGDLTTALVWIEAHRRWLEWSGAVLWQANQRLLRARHALASGDTTAARMHADAALTLAMQPRQPLALLAIHRLLGEIDAGAGRHAEATNHMNAALALAEACATPYERALTLLSLAELRAAERKPDEAIAALTTARTLLADLGTAPALARTETIAQRLAAPLPIAQGDAENPFGLTAREAEVLRLLAEGLTDNQIAGRLYISRNTVNAHLRGVYGKLGVNTRTAAARIAAERGLT